MQPKSEDEGVKDNKEGRDGERSTEKKTGARGRFKKKDRGKESKKRPT